MDSPSYRSVVASILSIGITDRPEVVPAQFGYPKDYVAFLV